MAGRGKTERTRADVTEDRLGPGLDQQVEEEQTGKPIDKKERDKRYREKAKFVSKTCKEFCMLPENRYKFKTYLEECRKSLENDGTNKSLGMDHITYLHDLEEEIENLAGPSYVASEPHMRGREEEPAEALWGKMPATADYCTSTHLPIGGTQPSGFVDVDVAKCHGLDQTPLQPDVPLWTALVRLGMGPKVDPVSPGFHCKTRPPQESCNTEVISKMREMQEGLQKGLQQMQEGLQEGLQQMQDNMYTKIPCAVVAVLEQLGFCQQTNAPIFSPAGPHHNPLGKQGGTNAAAGSSGGPTTQSSPHNDENDGTKDSSPNLLDPGPETQTGDLADVVRNYFPSGTTGAMNSTATGAMGTSCEQAEELKRKREEELDGNQRSKRPTAADNTPSHPLIGGFMAEPCQDYRRSATALATQGSLSSTNEGTQMQMTGPAHDKEASTSSREYPQKTFTNDQLGQGSIEEPRLYKDATLDSLDWDALLDSWSKSEMFTGNLAGSSNVALVAMNSTATGGESHHDPLGMQGETIAAAGSSGGPTTQSSPHNENF